MAAAEIPEEEFDLESRGLFERLLKTSDAVSQDTQEKVVRALNAVHAQNGNKTALGSIYASLAILVLVESGELGQ